MMRAEFAAPPDTCACATCAACLLGIHSCCYRVVCHHTHRLHACNCNHGGAA